MVKEKLIKEYPLTKKIKCDFECYEVIKRRYVIFYEKMINQENIESLLNEFDMATKNNFSKTRTFIIVGQTDQEFKKEDLLFFNGEDTFVVYYLQNITNNEIYFNDCSIFVISFGLNWKKIIKRFNEILT